MEIKFCPWYLGHNEICKYWDLFREFRASCWKLNFTPGFNRTVILFDIHNYVYRVINIFSCFSECSYAQGQSYPDTSGLWIYWVHGRGGCRLCHQDYEYDQTLWEAHQGQQSKSIGQCQQNLFPQLVKTVFQKLPMLQHQISMDLGSTLNFPTYFTWQFWESNYLIGVLM